MTGLILAFTLAADAPPQVPAPPQRPPLEVRVDDLEKRVAALEGKKSKAAPKASTTADLDIRYAEWYGRANVRGVPRVLSVGSTVPEWAIDPLRGADLLVVPSGYLGLVNGVYRLELINGVPSLIHQKTTAKPAASSSGVVPAGMHAHTRTDGTVYVHGNENLGNPSAHTGVSFPWVRTAEAGQTIPTPTTFSPVRNTFPTFRNAFQSGGCPNGQCPR